MCKSKSFQKLTYNVRRNRRILHIGYCMAYTEQYTTYKTYTYIGYVLLYGVQDIKYTQYIYVHCVSANIWHTMYAVKDLCIVQGVYVQFMTYIVRIRISLHCTPYIGYRLLYAVQCTMYDVQYMSYLNVHHDI